ncbi:hypothetical protein Sjap_004744 [Stephania japonica]|uniref:Uncharacterized protein n=1 Tax=Stephania japonica TaxID=461633 RepID=A0AAP0K2R6_9MAGN
MLSGNASRAQKRTLSASKLLRPPIDLGSDVRLLLSSKFRICKFPSLPIDLGKDSRPHETRLRYLKCFKSPIADDRFESLALLICNVLRQVK